MNMPVYNASLSKSILSGLLSGLVAAFVGLIFTMAYREVANFATAEIIMPISLFLGLPIVLVLAGFAYYLLKRHLSAGTGWFIFLSLAVMVALLLFTIQDTKKEGGGFFSGLRGLCLGLEVITSLSAAFLIPYFARHPKIYE